MPTAPAPRPNVAAMTGYVPGEQTARRVVKLNTNENPYPPPPSVMRAVCGIEADALRRYPEPTARRVREAAARRHGVTSEQVLCGNGSDDLLTILVRTFVPDGGRIAYPAPTYSLYPTLAQIQNASVEEIDWADGWKLPVAALVDAAADLTVVVNPNAPSGTLLQPAEVAELAEALGGRPLLVDEAYADFAGVTCVGLIAKHPNVIVSRTLSKGFSLAGLRFGYAMADASVVAQMNKVRDSYNCDVLAQTAAVAALDNADEAADTWAKVQDERRRLTAELTALGFDVIPSHANFVLATCPDGVGGDGRRLYDGLKAADVLVRHWDKPGLADKIRVSVGTPADTDAFLEALRPLLVQTT